jgi:hypothetical protein
MTNEITKVNSNLLTPNLLPVERKIIERALCPRLKDEKPVNVVNELAAIFTTAYTIAGQQADDVTLALYVDEFYTKMKESYPSVTIEEIRVAIRCGVYGEYGDYYGLNPKSFVGFVRSYLYSKERLEAKRKFEIPVLIEYKPSPEEIEKKNIEFTNSLLYEFLTDNLKWEFIPTYIYDFLVTEGIIDLSNKTKKRLVQRAKIYLLQQKQTSTFAGQLSKLADSESIKVVIGKQFAVLEYFELCRLFGATIVFTVNEEIK